MRREKPEDGARLKKPSILLVALVAIGVMVLTFSVTAYYYETKLAEVESQKEETIASLQQENENLSESLNGTGEIVERLRQDREEVENLRQEARSTESSREELENELIRTRQRSARLESQLEDLRRELQQCRNN